MKKLIAFLYFLTIVGAANAGIVLDATRIIYRQGDREVNIRMNNNADLPVIAQSWIDNGSIDRGKPADEIIVPFNLTPPVARVDPGRGQTLRIFANTSELATDRESVFWLNVLEIPPKNKESNINKIEFTIRTSIKVIYRPKSIGRDVPNEAYKQISWKLVPKKGGKSFLLITNPTPFYYTFTSADEKTSTGTVKTPIAMVPPLGSLEISPEKGDFSGLNSISTFYINDWGVSVPVNYEIIK